MKRRVRKGEVLGILRQMNRFCVFCEIVAGREPADILYQDDGVIVFRNRLRWVPVMLLSAPTKHLTQAELWKDLGRVGEKAVEIGERLCPGGFRLVSNFGRDAMQSQDHAHVHVIGGVFLGEYA
jgi:histidine triad (HIT) family protein